MGVAGISLDMFIHCELVVFSILFSETDLRRDQLGRTAHPRLFSLDVPLDRPLSIVSMRERSLYLLIF